MTRKELGDFLRARRHKIVRMEESCYLPWDSTEGLQPASAKTIEVIDFDALCDAIDEFQAELRAEHMEGK